MKLSSIQMFPKLQPICNIATDYRVRYCPELVYTVIATNFGIIATD